MDKDFYVLNLNALYGGNSFAEHMSSAVGTNRDQISIAEKFDGSNIFMVPERITKRTWTNWGGDIPESVKYGEVVYGIYDLPKNISEDELNAAVISRVLQK